jgi:hypothetical protein
MDWKPGCLGLAHIGLCTQFREEEREGVEWTGAKKNPEPEAPGIEERTFDEGKEVR